MPARVVCISRADAAGGTAVGSRVAEQLGYRYVDEEIVELAAEKAGADTEDVADVEQRKSRLLQFIEDLVHLAPEADVSGTRVASQSHRQLIQDVIAEVADQGNAVIVAHAASHALAGRNNILRVLLTASPEARARPRPTEGSTARPPSGPSATPTPRAPTTSSASTASTRSCRPSTTSSSTPRRSARSRPPT